MTALLRRFSALIAVVASVGFASVASAQSTYSWNTNAVAGLWYNTGNWTGGPAGMFPGSTGAAGSGNAADIAQFDPTTTTQVGIPFASGATTLSLGAINFQSTTSITIGNSGTTSGTLKMNGNTVNGVANTLVAVGNVGADLTIASNVAGLSGSTTFQLGTTAGVFNIYGDTTPIVGVRNLTISTVISQAASGSGFTVQGGGNLNLTAANTFTGNVTVNTARLTISNGTALGTTAGKTIVNNGGALFLNNAGTVNENIDFTGQGFVADTLLFGAIRISNNNTTLGGTLTLTGDSQMFIQGSTTTLNGTLTESGGSRQFDLIGAGTLTANTAVAYTGVTTVQGTTFNLAGTGGTLLGTPSVTVSLGGTFRLSNTSGTSNLGDRLADTIPVNLINGTFNFTQTAVAATNYAETVGPLSVQSYLNTVSTSQAAAGQTSTLTFASLNRTNNGSVNFVGTGLGADTRNQVLFTAAPTITNGMIAPWTIYNGTAGAVGTTGTAGSQVNPTGDFASYGANGITAMTNVITSQNGVGWTGTSNIKLTLNDGGLAQSGNIPAINSLTILTTSDTPGTTFNNFVILNDGNNPNSMVINSGGILISGPHNLNVTAGTTITSGTSELVFNVLNGTTTFNPIIANNGGTVVGLTKVGNGILALGNNNSFSGPIIVNAGNNGGGLQITGTGAFGNLGVARSVTLKAGTGGGNGSTLNFPIGGTSSDGLTLPANITINMEGFLSGGAVNNLTAQGITGVNARSSLITNGNMAINGPITFTGNNFIQLQQNDTSLATTLTINGSLSSTTPGNPFTGWVLFRGGGNIVVNGLINLPNATIGTTEPSTVVTLNAPAAGTNNFLGLGITFGTVKLGTGTNILPATSTVFLGQANNANVGAFWLNGNNQTIAQLGIQATSTSVLTNNIVENGAAGNSTLTFAGNATPSQFDGTVQNGGAGLLNLNVTAGSLTLTGPNTYTGVTTVGTGATLGLASVSNAGSPGALGSAAVASANFSINGGTVMYVGGTSSSDRGFTVGASGATFNVTTLGGNVAFNGIATGAGAITKTGPGTLILGGANTYLGSTTVNGGTLRINNTSGSGTGPGGAVTLNNVGSTLMGTGTVGGPITINPNTVLSPGNNTVGTLSQGAFLSTWGPGGIFNVEYDGTAGTLTSGVNVDLFTSLGSLSVTADATTKFVINLTRVAGDAPQVGNTVTIATFATAPTINPSFFTFTGQFFNGVTPSIVANGNNVDITFAPLAPPPPQINWLATTSTNWSDPTNWDAGVIPQPGTVATFSLGSATQFNTNNDIVGLKVDGIRVSGTAPSAFTINGNPFTITTATGIDMSAASADMTVNVAITLGVSQSWTVNAARTLLMSGAIDGAATLTKAGDGTLQVNVATNSYSGGTVITGGVLEITQVGAGNLLIPTAGLSQIGTGAITINGGELRLSAGAGTVNNSGATPRTITFGADGGIFTMSKVINGYQPLVANNTGGAVAVVRSLTFNSDNWSTNNGLNINSGQITGTGPVRYEFLDGSLLTFNQSQTVPMNFTFQGPDNGSAAANRTAITATGATGATVPTTSHQVGRFGIINATMTFSAGLEFRNAVQVSEFNGGGTIDADITFRSMPNGTFVGFEARGTGTAGAYSPITLGTTLNARTITIENNATMVLDSRFRQDAVNVGPVIVNARTVIQPGGTMEFAQSTTTGAGNNETGTHLVNGAIRGTGNDSLDARVNLLLPNKTTNGTSTGGVNWSTGAALEIMGTGTGGLRVEGTSAFIGTSGSPSFYSAARINGLTGTGGTLTFAPSNAGMTLNLAPTAASVVQLGVASSGAGVVPVTIGASANDLANWGGLVVKGSSGGGTTAANLATNQTFASTTIIGGTLSIGNGVTLTSPLSIATGGTLGGTGTVTGAIAINAGGILAPGNSIGTLSAGAGVTTWAPAGQYTVEYDTTSGVFTSGTSIDYFNSAGSLTVSASNTAGNQFVINLKQLNTGGTVSNPQIKIATFAGGITGFSADKFSVTGDFYSGMTPTVSAIGNDIVLTFSPVPEPVTVLGLAAVGLTGAGWVRRRRAARV
ncbi:MAG TPA: autotransporter-associated beta strand repeat-containing protein [Fimbriiglobus sp.]|jgi:autotransporter-associated beta strand protein